MSLATERHIYGLRAVERMTGLSTDTILDLENRHGVAKPVPGASGEMLYSRDDVEELLAFGRGERPLPVPSADGALQSEPAPAGPTATPSPRAKPSEEPTRLLVLLAERDPYAADLTEYFLRTEGYAVTTVFSLEDAQKNLEQAQPDLAIVELLLEGGAGFSLVEQINASGQCPVIVLSAINPGDHPAVSDAAVILPKPVKSLELVSAVRDLLGTSALVKSSDPGAAEPAVNEQADA